MGSSGVSGIGYEMCETFFLGGRRVMNLRPGRFVCFGYHGITSIERHGYKLGLAMGCKNLNIEKLLFWLYQHHKKPSG